MANKMNLRLLTASLLMVLAALPAHAEKITIAATVNDDVITSLDVAERRSLFMANAGIPNTPEAQQQITPRVIQMLVEEALQLQEAKRQSITITDEEVEKTINALGAPSQPAGSVRKKIAAEGLSVRSLGEQMRAQLAWAKVVQRKLRRNVTISQDELARAQQAQAADVGVEEIRLAVLAIAVPSPDKEAATVAMANDMRAQLDAGHDLPSVAEKYRSKPNVQYNPLLWVTEERTPPALFALIKDAKEGALIGPSRIGNIIQFVKLLERRVTKKPASSTEVLLKHILLDIPPKTDKVQTQKLADSVAILRQNAGNCDDTTLPATPLRAQAEFMRTTFGALNPEVVSLLVRMDVGALSAPQVEGKKLRLVQLCERSESAGGVVVDEELKQKLFAEKMELEAQKHLRNLRREATIDIRGEQ